MGNRYRSNHKSNELQVPGMESSSGRTSPRPGVPKTMIAKQSGRPSLNIKRPHGRKTPGSRRKSTSHIVPMTKGAPLASCPEVDYVQRAFYECEAQLVGKLDIVQHE